MNLAACEGTWQQTETGAVLCQGTLQIVVSGGPFGLPPISYTDANLLLTGIGVLWASVFAIRQIRRLF